MFDLRSTQVSRQLVFSVKKWFNFPTTVKLSQSSQNSFCALSATSKAIKYFFQGFYYRIESIFVLPIVSDWSNVFIVTWLSYAEEELTYSLALAPDWLTKR